MKNNKDFLNQNLIFSGSTLFFIHQNKISLVMDIGEDLLMSRTADLLIKENDNFLEVGFGLGIMANYAQKKKLKSHTIVEAHPQVYSKLLEWSKDKENVFPIFGDWFTVLDKIKEKNYDSVYFDTHFDENEYRFLNSIESNINTSGRYCRYSLDCRDLSFLSKELSNSKLRLLVHEDCEITPNPNLTSFTRNTFPICVFIK